MRTDCHVTRFAPSFFALRAGFAGCATHTPAGVIAMTGMGVQQ